MDQDTFAQRIDAAWKHDVELWGVAPAGDMPTRIRDLWNHSCADNNRDLVKFKDALNHIVNITVQLKGRFTCTFIAILGTVLRDIACTRARTAEWNALAAELDGVLVDAIAIEMRDDDPARFIVTRYERLVTRLLHLTSA